MSKPAARYAKHGRWVGLYSALSFVLLFLIGYAFDVIIYKRLAGGCGSSTKLDCTLAGSVTLVDLNVRFGTLNGRELALLTSIVIVMAVIIGVLVARLWDAKWKFLLPIFIYALVPLFTLATPWYLMGMRLVAFFYATLIYVMRFAIRFNPHLKVEKPYPKGVMLAIFQIYHQYVLLSLAVIGLSLTTFIFGFETLVRDYWSPAWADFPTIRGPIYTAHMLYLGIGITGLALGFVRQFHVKQEEVLNQGFDSRGRLKRIQRVRPRSGQIQ